MLLHVDDLAELIKRVMTEKDWTLSTLARRSGLSTSTLHSWKSGHRATGSRGPTPDKLRQLAEGAGLPVNQVFEAAGRHVLLPWTTKTSAVSSTCSAPSTARTAE